MVLHAASVRLRVPHLFALSRVVLPGRQRGIFGHAGAVRRWSRLAMATPAGTPAGLSALHVLAVLVAICALTVTACGATCSKCAPLPSSPEAGDAASEQ
jgi:hypothetical protein